MAFPTSPSDGDLYKNYVYRSATDLWQKVAYDPASTFGGLTNKHMQWTGASGAQSTGIDVNSGGYGGSIFIIASNNTAAGDNTDSGLYLVRLGYDGNNYGVTPCGGDNAWSFSLSGSTLLITGPGGNNQAELIYYI